MAHIIRTGEPSVEGLPLDRLIEEFIKSKEFEASCAERTNTFKQQLVSILKDTGEEDDKGSLWIRTDQHSIKYERRSSFSLNTEEIEKWATETGNLDKVTETVVSISEEKFLAFAFENPDLLPDMGKFYNERTSWAFKAVS